MMAPEVGFLCLALRSLYGLSKWSWIVTCTYRSSVSLDCFNSVLLTKLYAVTWLFALIHLARNTVKSNCVHTHNPTPSFMAQFCKFTTKCVAMVSSLCHKLHYRNDKVCLDCRLPWCTHFRNTWSQRNKKYRKE
jgi:hypothetical protein